MTDEPNEKNAPKKGGNGDPPAGSPPPNKTPEGELKEHGTKGRLPELIKVLPPLLWVIFAISAFYYLRAPITDLAESVTERIESGAKVTTRWVTLEGLSSIKVNKIWGHHT